jgi:RimJ/RimL family protein N-acetyltransferase
MTQDTTNGPIVWRRGKLVILRPLEMSDAPTIYRGINDPLVNQYLASHGPKGLGFEEEWIRSKQTPSATDHTIAICLPDGTLIGTMGLHQIDLINRVATTGSVIFRPEHQNHGYGTDAKMLLLDYAFNQLGLHKVCSSVIAFNGRSAAYSRKCGYVEEGRKRSQWFRHGERHDDIMLAVFRDDWLPLWEEYKKGL